MKQVPSCLPNDALEKISQSKALTVLNVTKSNSSPSQLISSSTPKERKKPITLGALGTSGKNSTNAEHFRPVGKAFTLRPANEMNNKIHAPRYLCATGIQGASKANSTIINTSELSKNISTKSSVLDVSTAVSPKKQSTGVTSSSDTVKSHAESLPNTPTKQTPTSSRVLKSVTTTK